MNSMCKQVLLVEDNPMDARLIQEALTGRQNEKLGYNLTHVTSLKEAKSCVARGMGDIVLLDLGLPDSKDIGSVNELCAARENAPPIVVLTGRDDDLIALQALQSGAQDYLLKSNLDTRHLDRTLNYAIERHRLVVQLDSARKEAAELAMCDSLTGLPNRRFLEEKLALSPNQSKESAVIFIDLDGFKAINDTHGHNAGDQLLKNIAKRISQCLRRGDLVARMGGDEFVCLATNLDAAEQSSWVAKRLIESITKPVTVDDLENPISVGASMGIALYPKHGKTMRELLEKSDKAMYQAKQTEGSLYEYYNGK